MSKRAGGRYGEVRRGTPTHGLLRAVHLHLCALGRVQVPEAAAEQLGLLAVEHGPGPGVAVEAADKVVDGLGRLAEVSPAQLGLVEESVVRGPDLGLLDARRPVLGDHLNGLGHGPDALRVHEAVVQRVHGVVDGDGALPGQQDVPSVEAVVGVEDGEASLCVALYKGNLKI